MMVDRIPILRMGRIAVVTLQTELTDSLAIDLQADLAMCVSEGNVRGVLIDVSALAVVDTFIASVLLTSARILALQHARCVVCGVRPHVAMTLVDLGMDLSSFETALDAEAGLGRLLRGLDAAEPLSLAQ